jgi:prepilin-type N-terminal cleavage/methylation domain-containing protein
MRRKGFTLVEVLVAVLIIDVGLLALVAGSAVVVRRMNAVHARAAAYRAASERIARLAAGGCRTTVGDTIAPNNGRETWSVELLSNGTGEVRDSIALVAGGVPTSVRLTTRLPC